MKVVILAGGVGSRLAEETGVKPKPMVEIGDKPMLWHIMKIYSHYGLNEFVICLGYKGNIIKEYFANYFLNMSDVRYDLKTNAVECLSSCAEPWTVTLVDTGETTLTGGRLRRARRYIGDETFCMTYGDGVSDVCVTDLIAFHRQHQRIATVTAIQPPGRFGTFTLQDDHYLIDRFREKPIGDGAWVNGGFFVLESKALDYIDGDMTTWEREPMQNLAREGELCAFKHTGFWQCMDTLRDKMYLENLWNNGDAPWKVWQNENRRS